MTPGEMPGCWEGSFMSAYILRLPAALGLGLAVSLSAWAGDPNLIRCESGDKLLITNTKCPAGYKAIPLQLDSPSVYNGKDIYKAEAGVRGVAAKAAGAQHPLDPVACSRAEHAFTLVATYRDSRPSEWAQRREDVFNACGYMP